MFEGRMALGKCRILFIFAAVLSTSVCILLQYWGSSLKSEQLLLKLNYILTKSDSTVPTTNSPSTTALKINPLSIKLRTTSIKVDPFSTALTTSMVNNLSFTLETPQFNPLSSTLTPSKIKRKNTTASKSSRNLIYLVQTESCLSDYLYRPDLFGEGCTNDVIILSWKQPCTLKSSSNLKHIKYIYKKGTTWSVGRNILYDIAKKLPKTYLYYIFMDDDLKFDFTDSDFEKRYRDGGLPWPLQAFEDFLLKHEPAIGMPVYCSTCTRGNETHCCDPMKTLKPLPEYLPVAAYFDAAFNAFHKDTLDLMLPYRLDREQESWWQSQKFVILAADLMFRGQVLRFFPVTVLNLEHREYPRSDWDNWGHIYDILKARMPEKYRVKVNWKPDYNNINVKPIVRNKTMFTPMWSVAIPSGKITIEPYKYFCT